MGKIVALTDQDAHYKAQAQSRLSEARRILRQLAAERQREQRRRVERPDFLSEIKAILRAA